MGSHVCTIGNIDVVLESEILLPYTEKLGIAVEKGIDRTGNNLKKDTKRDAPVDGGKWQSQGFPPHRDGGTFKRHIASRRRGKGLNHSYMWYVKSPEHRLTHLLANGHGLKVFGRPTGKRTKADPFLHNAYDRAKRELLPNIKTELP